MKTLALTAALLGLVACGTEPVIGPPTVAEVVPATAAVGDSVVLHGSGFGTQGESFVTVRGVAANVASWSNNRIELIVPDVPAGATVVVVNLGEVRTSPVDLTVTP